MSIIELISTKQKKTAVDALGQQIKIAQNYCDVMHTMTDGEWQAYRIFTANQTMPGMAGLSPEGNFNVYAESADLIRSYLSHLKSIHPEGPRRIMGPRLIGECLEDFNGFTKAQPFLYLKRPAAIGSIPEEDTLAMREVTKAKDDWDLVKRWYDAFNAEHNSVWSVPLKSDLGQKRFFLAFDRKGRFVGGCANSLNSHKRFWIGRLYIFPKYRRRGYARTLTIQLINNAVTQKRDFCLLANTNNSSAVDLYQSLGCEAVGENCFWMFPQSTV